tara:strand:- start:130 stop:378 length:249 start_codon:yes stop_codon:yes gene_type:complete
MQIENFKILLEGNHHENINIDALFEESFWSSSLSVYIGSGVSTGPQSGQCLNKGTNGGAHKIGFNAGLSLAEKFNTKLRYEL